MKAINTPHPAYNEGMTARLRLNSWILPVLVVFLVALQIIDPARTWFTLLVILGGAWLVGWLWARALARGLHFTREVRYGWAQVGDELEERFRISNSSAFPATWVEIDDYSTMPDYHPSMATVVEAHGENEFTTRGLCSRRGLYTLGGTTLQSGDPLGIYTVRLENLGSQTLLVLPPVIPLPAIDVTPGGFLGEGRPRNHAPQQSVGAAGVREYQPGDALRLIHWPSTAKHDKTFVRLLDGTPSADWWVLLDLDINAQVGTGWDSTEEHAVVLAASLTDHGLRLHKDVGLAVNGLQAHWQAPRGTPDQRWAILRALALARPGAIGLDQYLASSGKAFGRRSSLVIITANVTPAWLDSLALLRWQGRVVPTVLLLDPISFGGESASAGLAWQLQQMGVSCHVITRDLLDRPEAHPGQAGRWEFRTSATGKAIPIRKPVEAGWSRLG